MSNYAYRDIERKIVLYSSQAIKEDRNETFYCPNPKCEAKLYICAIEGSKSAYFRATKPMYKHILNCPFGTSSSEFDKNKFDESEFVFNNAIDGLLSVTGNPKEEKKIDGHSIGEPKAHPLRTLKQIYSMCKSMPVNLKYGDKEIGEMLLDDRSEYRYPRGCFGKKIIEAEDNRQKFSEAYDKVHDQLCIRWNITMGLYWIRPYTFINLDSRNRWFIADVQNMSGEFVVAAEKKLKKVPYAADYLEIKDLCKKALDAGEYKYKNFPDLSYTAWVISEQVNQEKAAEKGKKTSKAEFLKWFMPLLQALRDLGGSATPVEARKKIIENEHLSDEIVSETRGKTKVNKFENEVAFARNYLVGAGYIDKSVRGVWTLTEAGKSVELTAEMASDIFKKGVSDAKSKKTNDSDALSDSDVDTVHYWIYAPGQNADKWEECYKNGYMLLGWGEIGDLGVFSSKDEMKQQMKKEYGDSSSYKNSAHATWQFVHDIKIGDVVYVKKGNNGILGKGIVESDYEYDADRTDEYSNVRKVNWTNKGDWTINHQSPQKTLTDITPYSDFVQEIKALFEEDDIADDEKEIAYPEYTAENFLDDVYMSEDNYTRLVGLLRNKKNIILQGAPGVGKTYAAKRLAYSMMGVSCRFVYETRTHGSMGGARKDILPLPIK